MLHVRQNGALAIRANKVHLYPLKGAFFRGGFYVFYLTGTYFLKIKIIHSNEMECTFESSGFELELELLVND